MKKLRNMKHGELIWFTGLLWVFAGGFFCITGNLGIGIFLMSVILIYIIFL